MDIGKEVREVEFEPLTPSTDEPAPAEVPAPAQAPQEEPVGA